MTYSIHFKTTYNPEPQNQSNKPLYRIIKSNHVDTLHHDLKILQRKYSEDNNKIIVEANRNYQINENRKTTMNIS